MRSDTKPPPTEPLEPQFNTLPVVESWPNIEVERGCAVRTEAFTGVKVNDVSYAVTAPVDHPVVSVKWGCVSRDSGEIPRDVPGLGERRLTLTAI